MLKRIRSTYEKAINHIASFISKPISALENSDESALSGAALTAQTILRKQVELNENLPTEIVEAFDDRPLAPNDPRFVGRTLELDQIADALTEWRAGRGSLTAIIAPHGAGLTTLLNQARHLIQGDEELSYLSLAERIHSSADALRTINSIFELDPQPLSVAEMILAINKMPRRVIMIDDAHMLLARSMGNQAAVQTIGALLVATQVQHCWIIGCAKQAWRRLSFLYQTDHFFNRLIELDYFSLEELSEIIERRFYGLGYEWSARIALEQEKSDPMIERFRQLHSLSNGLPEMAFFFLLFAMSEMDGKIIKLQPFSSLDTSAIKSCSEEELFSLAEIFVHGVLDHVEHEALFRISSEQSMVRLERLCRTGILQRIRTNEHYASNSYYLSPILAQAVVQHLVISNRLY